MCHHHAHSISEDVNWCAIAWALSLPPIIAATASSTTLLRPTRKPSTESRTIQES